MPEEYQKEKCNVPVRIKYAKAFLLGSPRAHRVCVCSSYVISAVGFFNAFSTAGTATVPEAVPARASEANSAKWHQRA